MSISEFTDAQRHELMMHVPAYVAATQLQPRSKMRAFLVKFDNSKKRKPGTTVERYEAEGVVYSSGHVCLDTEYTPTGYHSIDEMEEVLGKYGNVQIEWLRLEDV